MMYLLDTNICIYLIKKQPPSVLRHLKSRQLTEVSISTVTLAELQYGVRKSLQRDKNQLALNHFLLPLEIIPFDASAADIYGTIRSDLESRGKVIGPLDMMIAAHAKSCAATLVTNNLKEFSRVKDLKLENWVD